MSLSMTRSIYYQDYFPAIAVLLGDMDVSQDSESPLLMRGAHSPQYYAPYNRLGHDQCRGPHVGHPSSSPHR